MIFNDRALSSGRQIFNLFSEPDDLERIIPNTYKCASALTRLQQRTTYFNLVEDGSTGKPKLVWKDSKLDQKDDAISQPTSTGPGDSGSPIWVLEGSGQEQKAVMVSVEWGTANDYSMLFERGEPINAYTSCNIQHTKITEDILPWIKRNADIFNNLLLFSISTEFQY